MRHGTLWRNDEGPIESVGREKLMTRNAFGSTLFSRAGCEAFSTLANKDSVYNKVSGYFNEMQDMKFPVQVIGKAQTKIVQCTGIKQL